MSYTDQNLGFTALNSDVLPVATAVALDFIANTVGESATLGVQEETLDRTK